MRSEGDHFPSPVGVEMSSFDGYGCPRMFIAPCLRVAQFAGGGTA